jgi:hypothetical protein
MKFLNFKILFAIFGCVLFSNISASTTTYYYDYIEQAQNLFKSGNYLLSAQHYDSAFTRWSGTKEHLYEASKSWAYVNNEDKSYQYILKAINKRFYDKDVLINDVRYKNGIGNKLFKKVIIQLTRESEKFHAGINDSLRNVLNHLYYIDQRMRKLVDPIESKYTGRDHPEIRLLWDRIGFVDSIKTYDLTKIIEKFGYPDISLVGEAANHSARLILNHSPIEIQEKYLPYLKESCEKGESVWKGYAYVFDRIRSKQKQKVKYGCSMYFDDEKNSYMMYAEDKNCINYFREQVGLPPMKTYRKYEDCSFEK